MRAHPQPAAPTSLPPGHLQLSPNAVSPPSRGSWCRLASQTDLTPVSRTAGLGPEQLQGGARAGVTSVTSPWLQWQGLGSHTLWMAEPASPGPRAPARAQEAAGRRALSPVCILVPESHAGAIPCGLPQPWVPTSRVFQSRRHQVTWQVASPACCSPEGSSYFPHPPEGRPGCAQ